MTDDAIAEARWQGRVDAKLDALIAQLAGLTKDKDRVHADHEARIDSLESFRDRMTGMAVGVAVGAGAVGGGIASLVSHLIGG